MRGNSVAGRRPSRKSRRSALKLTAQDLLELDVVDTIISEPLGGAHRNPEKMIRCLAETLRKELQTLMPMSAEELLEQRYQRFRKLGRSN